MSSNRLIEAALAMTVRKMKISGQERRYDRASNRFEIGRGLRSNPCGGVGAARGNRGCLGIAAGTAGGSECEERAVRAAGSHGTAARPGLSVGWAPSVATCGRRLRFQQPGNGTLDGALGRAQISWWSQSSTAAKQTKP